MTARERRAQRKALKAQMKAMRAQVRAQVAELPAVKRARQRRTIRRAITATIILLLLLLIRCDCGPGAGAVKELEKPEVEPKTKPDAGVKVPPKKPLTGKGTRVNRGAFGVAAPPPPSWIDEFQLQVAARSPRLAQCFLGVERPGALRWAASVNGKSGAATDHEFELIGSVDDLTADQRECLIKVLSYPPYKLTAPEKEALPNRVGMVIEF